MKDRPGRFASGPLEVRQLGLRRYEETLELQRALVAARKANELPDQLILMEHYPVITIGSGGGPEQLNVGEARLAQLGIEFFNVDRGGGAAYHGPGQLVAYPIVDLSAGKDLHDYLRRLEASVIATLAEFEVIGARRPGRTGVWCGERKIASIGIRAERWVTSHGLSININNDLRPFDLIKQCGLEGVKATSVKRITGRELDMASVARVFAGRFAAVFSDKESICRSVPVG
ncbi:MAG: lipoyl(octanoyl) transferase LipB [Actinomycetota bacterium]|nr:lipoyl(octanoyl) transferase LipB [Actinomycetota bacterium]